MLKIFFGSHPDEIYNTEKYYSHQYDKNWVMDEFAQRITADIDDSTIIAHDAKNKTKGRSAQRNVLFFIIGIRPAHTNPRRTTKAYCRMVKRTTSTYSIYAIRFVYCCFRDWYQ